MQTYKARLKNLLNPVYLLIAVCGTNKAKTVLKISSRALYEDEVRSFDDVDHDYLYLKALDHR